MTPLQKLISYCESEKGSYIPNAPIFQMFIDDAKKYLEDEREVIMHAFEQGWHSAGETNSPESVDYYNLNFDKTELRK